MRYLVFDISNLLHRTFFAQKNEDDETIAGMATHMALTTLNKYFKQFKPHQVVMAFDRSSWRKQYTKSDACLSKKPYKGNRRKDMSPSQELKYQRFMDHLKEFEALIAEHTTIMSLAADNLEADDLIAGFAQVYSDIDNEIIIISADSDLLQLTRHEGVRVISPATDKEQSLADFNNDPVYYLFQKCVRGDPTDNIQSAFPRVRSARILKAWEDPFERIQLMKEVWTDHNGTEFLVEDLFNENQLLIDLSKQPTEIRMSILETIDAEADRSRQFSMFYLLKFIGKYKLNKIKDSIDQYIPLLSR